MRKTSDSKTEFEESFDSSVFFVASPESFVPESLVPPTTLVVDPPLVVNRGLVAPNPNYSATLQPRLSADSCVDPYESPEESVSGFRAPEDGPDNGLVPDVIAASENGPARTSFSLKDDGKSAFSEEKRISDVPLFPCCPEETSIEIDSLPCMVDNLHLENELETIPKLAEDSPSVCSSDGGNFCRVCLDSDDTGVLLKPCSCRGTSAYCHTHCLQKWLRIRKKETDSSEDILKCGVCKDRFNVKITYERRERRIVLQIYRQKKDFFKFLIWFYCLSFVVISPMLIFRSCVDYLTHRSFHVLIVIIVNCAGFLIYLFVTIYGVNAWLVPAGERWLRSNRQLVVSAPTEEDQPELKGDAEGHQKQKEIDGDSSVSRKEGDRVTGRRKEGIRLTAVNDLSLV